jgi:hypothetical protein
MAVPDAVLLLAMGRCLRSNPRSRRLGLELPSQQHPPIKIVGPTVTMAWPPMGVPAAASSVSSETSQKKSSSVWSSSAPDALCSADRALLVARQQ